MASGSNLSPKTKLTTSPSPKDDIFESPVSFANLSAQVINPQKCAIRRNMVFFNGVGYNLNFNSPRTKSACLELGVTRDWVDGQMEAYDKIVNSKKKEIPEIKNLRMEHCEKRIKGKNFCQNALGSFVFYI